MICNEIKIKETQGDTSILTGSLNLDLHAETFRLWVYMLTEKISARTPTWRVENVSLKRCGLPIRQRDWDAMTATKWKRSPSTRLFSTLDSILPGSPAMVDETPTKQALCRLFTHTTAWPWSLRLSPNLILRFHLLGATNAEGFISILNFEFYCY